jgi:hypothetical protein
LVALAALTLGSAGKHQAAAETGRQAEQQRVYLPLISSLGTPDLLVSGIRLIPNQTSFRAGEPVQVEVTVSNIGETSAQPFWVDLYINPGQQPQLNRTWPVTCTLTPCQGVAWAVTSGLAPGETIVLSTREGAFADEYSIWSGSFVTGTTTLMAYADSWNPGKAEGLSGDFNVANNLAVLRALNVTAERRERATGSRQ